MNKYIYMLKASSFTISRARYEKNYQTITLSLVHRVSVTAVVQHCTRVIKDSAEENRAGLLAARSWPGFRNWTVSKLTIAKHLGFLIFKGDYNKY